MRESGFKMPVRSYIFPRRLRDWLLFMTIVVFVPFVYLVEVTMVLPYFHPPGSWMNLFHFIVALFSVTNLSCNFLGILVYDNSVPDELKSVNPKPTWEFCSVCEKYVPPRSWHCKVCQACILKRDHHCLFSGCCIGHCNFRYFIFFVMYMFLSSLYALIYNTMFLYYHEPFTSVALLVRLVCPVCMVFVDFNSKLDGIYVITFLLIFIAFTLSGILLSHHMRMLLQGRVSHERHNKYNLGWKKNLESSLGIRWYLTWAFPLVSSPLPHDGTEWTMSSDQEEKVREKAQ